MTPIFGQEFNTKEPLAINNAHSPTSATGIGRGGSKVGYFGAINQQETTNNRFDNFNGSFPGPSIAQQQQQQQQPAKLSAFDTNSQQKASKSGSPTKTQPRSMSPPPRLPSRTRSR